MVRYRRRHVNNVYWKSVTVEVLQDIELCGVLCGNFVVTMLVHDDLCVILHCN